MGTRVAVVWRDRAPALTSSEYAATVSGIDDTGGRRLWDVTYDIEPDKCYPHDFTNTTRKWRVLPPTSPAPSTPSPPPSMPATREARLVHFCHGAPGVVFAMAEAHRVCGDEQEHAEGEGGVGAEKAEHRLALAHAALDRVRAAASAEHDPLF